jgi:F-type H+-transporting ATPase subunit a
VNRIGKIIVVLALFAAAFVTSLPAETSAPVGGGTPASAATESSAELVSMPAPTLFHLFGVSWLPVTNSMLTTWVVALLIILVVRITCGRLSEVPGRGQNVVEALIEGWEGLMGNVLEPKVVKWAFPFALTYFIFIVISNLTDLLPFVGSVGYGQPWEGSPLPFSLFHVETPFLRPPTTDANLTMVMAAIFFVTSFYWSFRNNGVGGFIKHTFGVKVETTKALYVPLLLLFIFIGVMESFSILIIRPLALALRLYGNIFGGETMLTMAMTQKSFFMAILLALPVYFFETIVCLLQAFVFAMLSVAFVGTMCTHADEEHGH